MASAEPKCELCRVVRAVVYCKQDMTSLCLQCDGLVHSANCISQRHVRSLLCDRCNSQPATVRCLEDEVSLCESCECDGNSCLHQPLSFYSGSPSMEEFIQIWSSSPGCKTPNSYWEIRDSSRSLFWSLASLTNRMKELKTSAGMSSPSSMVLPQPYSVSCCKDQALVSCSVPQLLKVISSISLAFSPFFALVNRCKDRRILSLFHLCM